ncbi:hypothetical protein CK203_100803 [Vitis vinifera]|uniref:Retrovirus-related Pol polyprotein from transposon TNT 1-94 n=1 Tax=Vitis vinifera TaxID=29760 RepID=A0A438CKI7_VITVI|nr:hypothetical protein CK203_100803 [Vitis vinifera]
MQARLVILGNKQVEGIDYNETFASIAKMVTVRTFLAVAAAKGWNCIKWMYIMPSYTTPGGSAHLPNDYLTRTIYCVHMLAQFMQQPKNEHWEAALRVVRPFAF